MLPVKVIDNEKVSLYYHPDTKIIHHEFHGFVFGPAFRDTLSAGVDLVKRNKATKWLSDDRMNSALTADDTEWGKSVWFPAVKAAGWKHWAVVMPEKAIGKLNMKDWIALYSSMGINARAFSNPDEAMAWLVAQ